MTKTYTSTLTLHSPEQSVEHRLKNLDLIDHLAQIGEMIYQFVSITEPQFLTAQFRSDDPHFELVMGHAVQDIVESIMNGE
jgi:hypothetical protein